MAIMEYTTPANIRAALGVSDEEVEDVDITTSINDTLLDEALLDISPTLASNYETVQATTPKSADEKRFVARVAAWANTWMAIRLLSSLPMFAPRAVQSEKDSFDRVADPYKNLKDDLPGVLNSLAQKIADSYATLFPGETIEVTSTTRILVLNAPISVDPVTG